LRSRASQAGLDKQERMSERSEFASAQSRREAQGTRRASMGLAFFGSLSIILTILYMVMSSKLLTPETFFVLIR